MTRPEVRLTITPGVARVNGASLAYSAPDIACIEIDMHSKYAVVGCVEGGGESPVVHIGADDRTLHTDTRATADTQVAFPDYVGWEVFVAECCRYTCRVVLVRSEGEMSVSGRVTTLEAPGMAAELRALREEVERRSAALEGRIAENQSLRADLESQRAKYTQLRRALRQATGPIAEGLAMLDQAEREQR